MRDGGSLRLRNSGGLGQFPSAAGFERMRIIQQQEADAEQLAREEEILRNLPSVPGADLDVILDQPVSAPATKPVTAPISEPTEPVVIGQTKVPGTFMEQFGEPVPKPDPETFWEGPVTIADVTPPPPDFLSPTTLIILGGIAAVLYALRRRNGDDKK